MKTFYEWLQLNESDAGLVQSIIANPNDPVSYLALADWLEENGHPAAPAIRVIGDGLQSGSTQVDRLSYLGGAINRVPLVQALAQLCHQYPGLGPAIAPATPDEINELLDGYTSRQVGQYSITGIEIEGGYFIVRGEVDVDLSSFGPGANAEWAFTATINDALEVEDVDVEVDDAWANPADDEGDDVGGAIDAGEIGAEMIRDMNRRLSRYANVRRVILGG